MKRSVDLVVSITALIILSPFLLLVSALIFFHDFRSPFYIAPRVGKDGKSFMMVKFRSMVVNADRTGVTSTAATDSRITPVGHFVRRWKLDELVQLWNVLLGDMSLVGPRPNVRSGTDSYTAAERRLLSVRPGITDFASIVFADESEILRGQVDADAAYDRLIRPWKSRLGLFYVEHHTLRLDFKLILVTLLAMVSRTRALEIVSAELARYSAPDSLIRIAKRQDELTPTAPPA